MFGNLKFDDIKEHVRNGGSLEVPVGEFGNGLEAAKGKGKVSQSTNFMDFLKVAKRRFRKSNPIAANQADYVNWILYDRTSFAASATVPAKVTLFNQPIGQSSKTKVDTNMEFVSKLPDPQWMNVTHVGFYFNNNVTSVDLDAFLTTEYMEFWVSQKVYLEGPVQCFPGGAGNFGSSSLGTMTAASTSWTNNFGNGWPSVHNLYDVRLPSGLGLGTDGQGNAVTSDGLIGITILQSQSFHVDLKADAGGATLIANNAVPIPGSGLTVGCYLHGVLSRGVQ